MSNDSIAFLGIHVLQRKTFDLYRVRAQRKDVFSRARNLELAETIYTWPARIHDTRKREIHRTKPVSFYRPSVWHGWNVGLKFKSSPYLDSFYTNGWTLRKHMVTKLYSCFPWEKKKQIVNSRCPSSCLAFRSVRYRKVINHAWGKNRIGYKWLGMSKFFGFATNLWY